MKIVFMGTPDFAVESLKAILDTGTEVAAVVTAPDRKSGRGQKVSQSAVKKFAVENNLEVLQPEKLKSEKFNNRLKEINADLFVVVAFRMLPESIWSMPAKGTINLHGSLLPQYRGAAPINWAVMNGETETGATTFFIEKEIDTGRVIDNVKVEISEVDTAGTVHDRLMVKGAELLSRTVQQILEGNVESKAQADLILDELKEAPKIFKPDCRINWEKDTIYIYNKIRGLSPYPTAWTELLNQDLKKTMKLFHCEKQLDGKNNTGQIKIVEKKVLFGTSDGWLIPLEVQLEGKKRMKTIDLMNGFKFQDWKLN